MPRLLLQGQLQFPVDNKVGQVSAQPQLRYPSQHLQRVEQIVQGAVTVGFHQHGKRIAGGESQPAFNNGRGVVGCQRHHLGNDI